MTSPSKLATLDPNPKGEAPFFTRGIYSEGEPIGADSLVFCTLPLRFATRQGAKEVGYHCPVVFAKKSRSSNISQDVYSAEIPSFTHGNVSTAIVAKDYLHAGERVLLVDDFLATGAAFLGLRGLVEQAGATVVGAVAAVEKRFQGGGDKLRAEGVRVESLARIVAMDDKGIQFG